jgi:diaminopropionate ammonia-lyase
VKPTSRLLLNPEFRPDFATDSPSHAPLEMHRRLPGYVPTPLHELPTLAARLGVGQILLKDEAARLGLPAYKILGAAWATYRALALRLGREPGPWTNIRELCALIAPLLPLTLVTATDGNHGRGVARVAHWLGLGAEVYLPQGSAPARIAAIRSEGARVVEVPGTYDEAVALAAAVSDERALLIQDHGWPGYEEIPNWVAEGYETMCLEIDAELARRAVPPPDLVLVQIGVGTLASAVIRHYRRHGLTPRPVLVGVEPTGAACALLSVAAGRPVMIPAGADASIMAGLNCGTPSTAAWPLLLAGMDAFVTVEDEQAREAMRLLAARGVVSGESGAAGLAGLLELQEGREAARARDALRITKTSRVLLFSTEGATDPVAWERVVGRPPTMPPEGPPQTA